MNNPTSFVAQASGHKPGQLHSGSFGFEKEKYDISLQVGELVLLPAVRSATDEFLIVADGYSCREQIAHRHGLHLTEVIHLAMQGYSAPSRKEAR